MSSATVRRVIKKCMQMSLSKQKMGGLGARRNGRGEQGYYNLMITLFACSICLTNRFYCRERATMSFLIVIAFFLVFILIILTEVNCTITIIDSVCTLCTCRFYIFMRFCLFSGYRRFKVLDAVDNHFTNYLLTFLLHI